VRAINDLPDRDRVDPRLHAAGYTRRFRGDVTDIPDLIVGPKLRRRWARLFLSEHRARKEGDNNDRPQTEREFSFHLYQNYQPSGCK
jgi:hypothetical protein